MILYYMMYILYVFIRYYINFDIISIPWTVGLFSKVILKKLIIFRQVQYLGVDFRGSTTRIQ